MARGLLIGRIDDDLADLLNHPPRREKTAGDTVGESDQTHATDDQARQTVEREHDYDQDDQQPPPTPNSIA